MSARFYLKRFPERFPYTWNQHPLRHILEYIPNSSAVFLPNTEVASIRDYLAEWGLNDYSSVSSFDLRNCIPNL